MGTYGKRPGEATTSHARETWRRHYKIEQEALEKKEKMTEKEKKRLEWVTKRIRTI
ncbi:MAG: hypothetical protein IJU03_10280 [Thermoguttaceae bacterium]|nr:hypothetical protein [Thermoguttaceae bacterium]